MPIKYQDFHTNAMYMEVIQRTCITNIENGKIDIILRHSLSKRLYFGYIQKHILFMLVTIESSYKI